MQSLFAPVLLYLPDRSLGVSLIEIQKQVYRKGEGKEPREEGSRRIEDYLYLESRKGGRGKTEQRTRKQQNTEKQEGGLAGGLLTWRERDQGVELQKERSRKEKLGT